MSREQEVITKFKGIFMDSCGIHDKDPALVPNDGILFGPESVLNLDSLDSLELAMLLEAHFNIKFDGKNEERKIFKNFDSVFNHVFEKAGPDVIESFLSK